MAAWKTSVAFFFGAAALAAAHNGALPAPGSEYAPWIRPAVRDVPSEAITAPATPFAGNGAYFPPTLSFRPGRGSLEITFGIDEGGPVTLEAFDSWGNLVATLLEGEKTAGFHRLSLFSNRLQGKTGQVFFRLRAKGAVLAEMRSASR